MIPGEYNSQKSKDGIDEYYKKLRETWEEHRSRESVVEEKKSDPNKVPLVPTGENTKIPSIEILHNLIKSYGYGGDYDDEDYSSTGSERTPNDDRSDSMNPNNQAYKSSMDNRSVQMNRK